MVERLVANDSSPWFISLDNPTLFPGSIVLVTLRHKNERKKTQGELGDNSKQEMNYKSLFENLISMILEPKIDVDTYLKDWIERATTYTRIA